MHQSRKSVENYDRRVSSSSSSSSSYTPHDGYAAERKQNEIETRVRRYDKLEKSLGL